MIELKGNKKLALALCDAGYFVSVSKDNFKDGVGIKKIDGEYMWCEKGNPECATHNYLDALRGTIYAEKLPEFEPKISELAGLKMELKEKTVWVGCHMFDKEQAIQAAKEILDFYKED